jgi:ABC-type sugar transport system substrate-binding protein
MQTDPLIGRQIDDFVIQDRLGRGGMATVFLARQRSVNRQVALKIITLDSALSDDDQFRLRFEQEARLIAALEHIHILPVYDYGIVDNEIAYLAMRLLRGGTLADLLRSGPLSFERTGEIFTQVARGLAYAHRHGVIHRDLKPSNIMLDDSSNAYLTDFGLAKLVEDSLDLTRSGHLVGTPTYMSPEQLRGEPLDQRSDIYSMGVILYHMLVGRPPFDASDTNMISVIYQHLERTPTPPSLLNSKVSTALDVVVMMALQKTPDHRYATADEMADDLNAALGTSAGSTSSYPILTSGRTQRNDDPSRPTLSLAEARAASESAHARSRVVQPRPRAATGARFGFYLAGAVLLLSAMLLGGAALLRRPAAPAERPTILLGQTGASADAAPTEAEIARARNALGANGFIALIACNLTSEYHATHTREMRDFAAGYGLLARVYDSDSDAYRQLTQIERARTEGARLLVICPLNMELLENALQSAQRAGLPMVFLQSDIPSYGGVLVGGDDYLIGLEAGRAGGRLINALFGGQAEVIVLDFPSMPIIVTRANGLVDGLLEIAPAAHVLGRYLGGTRENGRRSVSALLAQGATFDAILSINDVGAYGAIDALVAAGINPSEVIISSVDAEALALEYIANDYFIRASVEVEREQFSRMAIDAAVRLLAGATLPETFLVPPGAAITKPDLPLELEPERAS